MLEDDKWATAQDQMVRRDLAGRDITSQRVLGAMRRVPRHVFVPAKMQDHSYADSALPIGNGQTISQPYMVAYMTQLLGLEGNERVLEIGVGSGYQTAVLAELAGIVVGIERIAELAEQAQSRLYAMGYTNVEIRVADGSAGFATGAPYDAILVAAASPSIPEPLLAQLREGGRLVMPIGETEQFIERITRRGGTLHIEKLMEVIFVPLIGEFGHAEGRVAT